MTISKIKFEKRLFLVKEVVNEKKSINYISKKYDVPKGTLQDWVRRYEQLGEDALRLYKTRIQYSAKIKQLAVEEVLYGGMGIRSVLKKYNISISAVLRAWIANYNKEKVNKPTGRGLSQMKPRSKATKTSIKERIEIVHFTLAHEKDYQAAMKKYGISYQQVYTWVKKYEACGTQGLQDKRGRNQTIDELSELEQLKLENKRLKQRNDYLEMETDFVKKLQELRQRYTHFH
ncbi:helix-turn-helix domain-containing protein [Enterococcus sp. ALS3]|uniref:Helix-turn-helix domain-containing protein n=1 Tax=Enterococcus alishanensis TaxID=1303817 RepID=A0ABS6THP3_9ENTE|nr:helix-turn-helix domain-containing protein [Enterococcus alishanensis]MBV7392492.1 helix-turn-helix domain-containing protein [Enterococcus alishanensis]